MKTNFETLVKLAGQSQELKAAEGNRTRTELAADSAYQGHKEAFKTDLRAFHKEQKAAAEKGQGILGGPRKEDTEEQAFARRLAHEFLERAVETAGLAEAVAVSPEDWLDDEEDFDDYFEGLSLEQEVNGELERVFLYAATCGVDAI